MARFLLAQVNSKVGDFEGNFKKIADILSKASSEELVIFPESNLCGYPIQDLLEYSGFADQAELYWKKLITEFSSKNFIVGTVGRSRSARWLTNAANIWIHQKEYRYVKRLLPTYDVFDEARYFEAGHQPLILDWQQKKVAVTICEDIWAEPLDERWKDRYSFDPIADIKDADVIVNLSASPFESEKVKGRYEGLKSLSQKIKGTLIYVNAVGANDSLIFEGGSSVWKQGAPHFFGERFKESSYPINLNSISSIEEPRFNKTKDLYDALCLGLKDYLFKQNFTDIVLGMSGGIDSALTACLAADALGASHVHAVMIPSTFTSPLSIELAKSVSKNAGIDYFEMDAAKLMKDTDHFLNPFFKNKPRDVTEENLQARIRGVLLMALSNKHNWLPLATGNKSELAMGYCTLYGDMCGGLAPLADVYKTEVYELVNEANRRAHRIPDSLIQRPPTAELKEHQTDQDTLPPYAVLDKILYQLIEMAKTPEQVFGNEFDKNLVLKIAKALKYSEYKRNQMPLGLKVSAKAFGIGRRMPIVSV